MAMKHYEGSLGTFDYNDDLWDISLLLNQQTGETTPILRWKGTEKDDPIIPDGVRNIKYTFAHGNFKSIPIIPESVEEYEGAFDHVPEKFKEGIEWALEHRGEEWPYKEYEGGLGKFTYNSKQFKIAPPYSGGYGNRTTSETDTLIYIGEETDGSKIDIPLTNSLDNTFAGSNIESLPPIPDTVKSMKGMCAGCKNLKTADLESLKIEKLDEDVFVYCEKLKSVKLPKTLLYIGDEAFQGCESLEVINSSDKITVIEERAFYGCFNLKTIKTPKELELIGRDAFFETPSLTLSSTMYKKENIKKLSSLYFNTIIDIGIGLGSDSPKSRIAYKIQEYEESTQKININKLLDIKKEMIEKFSNQERTGKKVPKCIDQLAVVSMKYNIPINKIVERFNMSYVSNIIDSNRNFALGILFMSYLPIKDCINILNKGSIDRYYYREENKTLTMAIAHLLIKYGETGTEKFKAVADYFIKNGISHLTNPTIDALTKLTQGEIISKLPDDVSINDVKNAVDDFALYKEVQKINERYGIDLYNCVSDIPITKVKYGKKISRILDFNEKKDIGIAANLGYYTDCCQCLGDAGETAMMHSFLNPDGGFFVIEDEKGEIKAQAALWVDNTGEKLPENTLVFDNIEFANCPGEIYSERVEALRGDLATWAMNSPYENIVMGCGYNEFKFDEMEKSAIPTLTKSNEESHLLRGNIYTDIKGHNGCVYIKHDGVVSDYLMKGLDETKDLVIEEVDKENKTNQNGAIEPNETNNVRNEEATNEIETLFF